MYKQYIVSLLLGLIVCAAQADSVRYQSRSSRFRLARQEIAPLAPVPEAPQDIQPTPAAAPYPAAGVTPEIPFDLPTETEQQPDVTYGPPDNTYGPPTLESVPQPDNAYGPPDATTQEDQSSRVDATDDSVDANDEEPQLQSLINRQNIRLSKLQAVPQKLRSAKLIRSNRVLVYAL